MKMFKRVSMLVCAVSAFMLFSMTASASVLNYFYRVNKTNSDMTTYTNTTTQAISVTVYTRPDQTNGVVLVEIKRYEDGSLNTVASKYFPGSESNVAGITFDIPAQTTYYAYISTYLDAEINGILTATY